MTDIKVYPEKRINVTWVPDGGIADFRAPTAAELNAGVNLSTAIAWDSTTLPSAQDSSDIDDRAITDEGNATEAGFDQFGAELALFYPELLSDTSSDYVTAFNTFKSGQGLVGYLVLRFLPEGLHSAAFAAGQWVSVYKVISDYTAKDTEGEDSVKFSVGFLPQGDMKENAMVKASAAPTLSDATLAVAVGGKDVLTATLEGWDVTQGSTWASDDTDVATVSANGVVVGIAAGTADITATHPSGTAASTACTVTVS